MTVPVYHKFTLSLVVSKLIDQRYDSAMHAEEHQRQITHNVLLKLSQNQIRLLVPFFSSVAQAQ
ncbi:hypothetical protein NL529_34080, partial [Klebsiella pneumoniae]|nr:hypothetical protein [Klebsiella pneumoniae]